MEANAETAQAFQERALVKTVSHVLKEGEQFTESMRLQGGSTYTVVVKGWEHIEAVSLRLVDEGDDLVPPEVDEDLNSLHFTPPASGTYLLKVVLETIAEGLGAAEVGALVREEPLPVLPGAT